MALLAPWLADFQLLAAALLLGVMLAIALLRQPAQRLAVAKSTLVALAALALLCAIPGWSLVHLLNEQPTPAPIASPAPLAEVPPFAPTPAPLPFEPVAAAPSPIVTTIETPPTPPPAEPINWPAAIVTLYAAGCALVALWLAIGGLLARRVLSQATPAPQELEQLLAQITGPVARPPQLLMSSHIAAPVAMGLHRPAILLPASVSPPSQGGARGGITDASIPVDSQSPLPASSFPIQHSAFDSSPTQLLPILAHEWAHLEHRDLHTLAATRLLLILLWPQPLFWLLRRTIRLDQETLADAAAADRAGRLDYAQQLLAWARTASTQRPPRLAGAVGLWEGPSQLKRRIAVLLNEKFSVVRSCSRRWKTVSVGCIISLALLLSLVTLQPAMSASEKEDQPVGSQTTKLTETDAEGSSHTDKEPDGSERQAKEVAERGSTLVKQLARAPNLFMGFCINEAGEPLAGVDVSLYVHTAFAKENVQPIARVQTGADGRFEFNQPVDVAKEFPNGVPADGFVKSPVKVITAVAKAPGRATKFQNDGLYRFVKHGQAAILRMTPSSTLTGRVTDENGVPLANAIVSTSDNSGGYVPNESLRTRTDAAGRFAIDDLASFDAETATREHLAARARGEHRGLFQTPQVLLTVEHPGFANKLVRVKNIPGELEIALAPGATITGRVVAQGAAPNEPPRPLANAHVVLTRTRQPQLSADPIFVHREEQRGVTDAQGNYSFAALPASEYAVTATAPNLTTLGVRGVGAAAGQTVTAPDVVLRPGGVVRVKLVDGKTNAPLKLKAGQKGYIHPRRNPTAFYAPDSPSGPETVEPPLIDSPIVAFTADAIGETRLPPGKYSLFVSIPEADSNYSSVSADGHANEEEFEVREGETIERTVPMLLTLAASLRATATVQPVNQPTDGDDSAKLEEDATQSESGALDFKPTIIPADSNDEGAALPANVIEVDGRQVILGDPVPEAELRERGIDPAGERSAGSTQVAPPKTLYQATEQGAGITPPATNQATASNDFNAYWNDMPDSPVKLTPTAPLNHAAARSTHQPNALYLHVVDEKQQPLAGVEATLYRVDSQIRVAQPLKRLVTDAAGNVVFTDVVSTEQLAAFAAMKAAGRFNISSQDAYCYSLRRSGLATALVFQVADRLALEGAEQTLTLRPAAMLTGRVTSPDGSAVPNAKVLAGPVTSVAIDGINTVTTDDDGRFEFTDRALFRRSEAGTALSRASNAPLDPTVNNVSNLIVTHPDFAATQAEGGDVPGVVNVQMLPAASMTGRVVKHGSGEPASGVMVRAHGFPPVAQAAPTERIARFGHTAATTTDSDGGYRFSNLPAASYRVWAESNASNESEMLSRGHGNVHALPGEAPTRVPDLVIGPPAVVRVQLIDVQSEQPIQLPSGAVIQPIATALGDAGWQTVPPVRIDDAANGVFEMQTLPGTSRVSVHVFANRDQRDILFQSDVSLMHGGEMVSLKPGETTAIKLRVYPIAMINEIREREANAHRRLTRGEAAEALAEYSVLIAEYPTNTFARHNRANLHSSRGDYEAELADNEAILAMDPTDAAAMYGVAKLLATISNDKLRDGKRSLELTNQLLKQSASLGDQNWRSAILDIQAAAYAELGMFKEAIATQQQAIDLTSHVSHKTGMRGRLERFKLNKPSRTQLMRRPTVSSRAKTDDQGAANAPRLAPITYKPVEPAPVSPTLQSNAGRAAVPLADIQAVSIVDATKPLNYPTWELTTEPAPINLAAPATLGDAVK